MTTRGKVAFLNSPYILNEPFVQHMPPLSILYLSAAMEKSGYEPRIFNTDTLVKDMGIYYFGFDMRNLIDGLKEFKPDMIGITCPYSSRWLFTQRLSKLLKSVFPDIPIVIGGIHPTAFPEDCLASSDADHVIIGEGEETAVALLKHTLTGTKPYDVEGIAFKNNGKTICSPKKQFISKLDNIPFPAYHLIDVERYKHICRNDRISQLKGLYFSILTSRSCPNECTFCNMHLAHGRGYRQRSPENVLSEIEYLIGKYNVRQFAIVDDNFTLLKPRTLAILKGIIDRKMNIKFITPNGLSAKTLDDETIWHLKAAGALEICVAVESGSEYIRNTVYNKNISSEKIRSVVASCKRHGLPCKAFFMVGAPEDSELTVRESIDLMRQIKIPAYINITTPYKGTKLYDTYIAKGVINSENIAEASSIDLRLPVEKAGNYKKILAWRRKMQFFNILFSWRELLKSRGFLSVNTLQRFLAGIVFVKKIPQSAITAIMDKYLPETIEKK